MAGSVISRNCRGCNDQNRKNMCAQSNRQLRDTTIDGKHSYDVCILCIRFIHRNMNNDQLLCTKKNKPTNQVADNNKCLFNSDTNLNKISHNFAPLDRTFEFHLSEKKSVPQA